MNSLILLCQACDASKGANYTLRGLMRDNKRQMWMQNEDRARLARHSARERAEEVRTS